MTDIFLKTIPEYFSAIVMLINAKSDQSTARIPNEAGALTLTAPKTLLQYYENYNELVKYSKGVSVDGGMWWQFILLVTCTIS